MFHVRRSYITVVAVVVSLACHAITIAGAESLSCNFLSDAPVVNFDVPSMLHKLKFLNVQAKVYRQTLSAGSTPRLRFIHYSSEPVVDVKDDEIVISTKGNICSAESIGEEEQGDGQYSASSTTRFSSVSKLFVTLALVAGSSSHGIDSPLSMILLSAASSMFLPKVAAEILPQGRFAEEVGCTPSMEVVLEAPPYYLGSVDECLSSVTNAEHCPDPFPSFPACSDTNPSCKLAIVGAGTGGLYTALRLIEEGVIEGKDVCVFEATDRVAGRIYSLRGFGPENDISVDAGGYRTWPDFTPTTHALITEKLGLNMACYEEEEPCLKYNIVGGDGEKIGFATFVEEMMSRIIEEGACFYPRHELISIQHDDSGSNTLVFANGVVATATDNTILNLPQRPLLEVLRRSQILDDTQEEKEVYDSMHSVQTELVTKLYLYYEDAWWYKLGLTNGDFEMPGDARNMLLQGRYHDGHVKCDPEDETKCYGFLLAVYAHDFGGTKSQYFRRFQRDRPEPVTILSNTNTEDAEFLKHAHEQLRQFHLYENTDAPYSGFEAKRAFDVSSPPTFAVLSTWNVATYGAGGGWHHWTDLAVAEKAQKPLNDYNIHVVNEAFSKLQGWAEGSLLLADEVLEEYFGVNRPWSFEAPDFVQFLAQTASQECIAEEEEEDSGSNGGGGGDTADSGGGGFDPCFVAGSLVEMADGSMKPIELIQQNDLIATGINGQTGLVTEVLVHPVEKDLRDVVVLPTSYGDLVGTPAHPIFVMGTWMELRDAVETPGIIKDARIEQQKVDIFYNLEVDGHEPGTSSHSYVVNGIVASGLGDNFVLNTMFPRQSVWQEVVADLASPQ